MLFLSAGLGAALALAATASAIVIPPNLGIESLGDDNSIETLGDGAFKQAVTLDCPGCAVASGGKSLEWTQDVGASYLVNFEIGHNFATLDINGVQIYPPSFGHFSEPFTVTQVDAEVDKHLRLRVTGYSFYYNLAETINEAGTELLPMTFRITSVESQPVSPPALTIFLLKDNAGRLMIASINPASEIANSDPKEPTKECSKDWPLVCKWKSIVADKFEGLKSSFKKGCHKGKRPGSQENSHVHRPGRPHRRPHESQGQDHRRPHHRHHSKALARARWLLFTIVFPILIGIIAGAFTYLLGMVIGAVFALLWVKVRGAKDGGYEGVAQSDEEDVDIKASDKEVYSDLPSYEAPPVYEEAAEKEVVDGDN